METCKILENKMKLYEGTEHTEYEEKLEYEKSLQMSPKLI